MPQELKIVEGGCPLCGSRNGELRLAGLRDVENRVPGEYAISRCRDCQLHYLSTRPDEASLPGCYDTNYHVRFDRAVSPLMRGLFNARYALRMRRLLRHQGGRPLTSLLEIGCGDGNLLAYLEKAFPAPVELVGVELDARHIRLPEGSRIRLHEADFDQLDLGRQFDVVVMYHVLEHLVRPVETLRRIRSLLKPGGLLLFQVPNWNTCWRSLFPRHWNGLQIPRHQFFLDPPRLADLCARGGFRLEAMSGLMDPGDFAVSVCNWITERLHLKTLPRRAWFYLPAVILGAGLVAMTNLVTGQSGEMEAIARPAG
ncbi:MAG TPA: class I SAM-dependent methyltransferase [Kiritimatiellia bacterium]|nr:class I SAM-dependent methyltransferase [Kiritimatiellia bacterium]HRZ11675.1 class I SAM-dependent methyltransferase [Kiritimatiellia bacterium]HSA16774.1 class I SAM-dependent methyltransferase [Kiritimatiellia bacterium]